MFARAVPVLRLVPLLLATVVVASGCGGGESQGANEPKGTYRVEVADASFPARQSIAEATTMRIRVRNPEQRTIPNVAVTVETKADDGGEGVTAFGQSADDPRLADDDRPVWILDRGPVGGTSAYANTWSLGALAGGQTKTFEWKLTAVEPGDYSLAYRVSPGLDGKATLAAGSEARGTFTVQVAGDPVPARVNSKGEVVRGEEAGAGKN